MLFQISPPLMNVLMCSLLFVVANEYFFKIHAFLSGFGAF